MNEKVRAIVIQHHGAPEEVARVAEVDVRTPQFGEARIRVLASPINPADLNVLEGKYPIRPTLPGVPGVEGAGEVESVGAGVENVRPGDMVLLPHAFGAWRQAGVANAADLIVVPPGIAPEQAAMLKINPPTALRMLRDFTSLQRGEFVVQNAPNSGVGRAVIQIAKATGLRTINLVRRIELMDELVSAGADFVFADDEKFTSPVDAPIRLALNAVGGESALRVANALATSGTLVTYGAMSRHPLRIPNGLLIFKDIRFRGFWITSWMGRAMADERNAMFDELFALAQRGTLHTPVERIYPLEAAAEALAHAARSGRAGKILFAPNLC